MLFPNPVTCEQGGTKQMRYRAVGVVLENYGARLAGPTWRLGTQTDVGVAAVVWASGLNWIVERSFARLGRNRRMAKDYEFRVQTSETLITIAACAQMLRRDDVSRTLSSAASIPARKGACDLAAPHADRRRRGRSILGAFLESVASNCPLVFTLSGSLDYDPRASGHTKGNTFAVLGDQPCPLSGLYVLRDDGLVARWALSLGRHG